MVVSGLAKNFGMDLLPAPAPNVDLGQRVTVVSLARLDRARRRKAHSA